MTGPLRLKIICTLTAIALAGCHSIDIKNQVVYGRVYVPFKTVGDWEIYGVSGALQSRRFIRWERVPANYPFTDVCSTGFGGVMLACSVNGDFLVYDLACPVEHSQSTLVYIDESNYARCPKCGSLYDVFQLDTSPGYPVGGPALDHGYGLTPYNVAFGADGNYALLTN